MAVDSCNHSAGEGGGRKTKRSSYMRELVQNKIKNKIKTTQEPQSHPLAIRCVARPSMIFETHSDRHPNLYIEFFKNC